MTLPTPANAPFKIDDAQVAGLERQDTRHGVTQRGLTSRRIEYLPGGVQPFVIKGRARKPQLYILGYLRTANFDAMHALLETHRTWFDTTTTCKVTIHGTDYDPVTPIEFRELEPTPRAFADEDQPTETPGAKLPVLFLFQVL